MYQFENPKSPNRRLHSHSRAIDLLRRFRLSAQATPALSQSLAIDLHSPLLSLSLSHQKKKTCFCCFRLICAEREEENLGSAAISLLSVAFPSVAMARRGRKKAAKESPSKPNESTAVQSEDRQRSFNEREVERRIAAIHAICEAETENLLSRLRLLRSYISKEQMETPALQFFQENLPNLTIMRNEKYKIFELTWNSGDSNILGKDGDDKDMRISLGNAAKLSAVHGLQFSVNSVKKNFLQAASLHLPDFGLGEYSENQMGGAREAFQTPGAMSNRLSFGMTPKTLRLPKNGEMLLSVRGSPLGVYKEENLAAIHESGHDAS